MNSSSNEPVTVTFTGQIILPRESLLGLLRQVSVESRPLVEASSTAPEPVITDKPMRLAYSMRETAAMLGVSYITVHRLLQRGLFRCSLACRHKMIAKTEIERFLADTSAATPRH